MREWLECIERAMHVRDGESRARNAASALQAPPRRRGHARGAVADNVHASIAAIVHAPHDTARGRDTANAKEGVRRA
ncbi:MAG: hypothetical protein JO197_10585 [Acidobacteria bacterium]|nr:hypothetical protein [Acidobacteriota bacterium]MBV9475499.1 hypothetical protein [Acidobacteriota bacterium]